MNNLFADLKPESIVSDIKQTNSSAIPKPKENIDGVTRYFKDSEEYKMFYNLGSHPFDKKTEKAIRFYKMFWVPISNMGYYVTEDGEVQLLIRKWWANNKAKDLEEIFGFNCPMDKEPDSVAPINKRKKPRPSKGKYFKWNPNWKIRDINDQLLFDEKIEILQACLLENKKRQDKEFIMLQRFIDIERHRLFDLERETAKALIINGVCIPKSVCQYHERPDGKEYYFLVKRWWAEKNADKIKNRFTLSAQTKS